MPPHLVKNAGVKCGKRPGTRVGHRSAGWLNAYKAYSNPFNKACSNPSLYYLQRANKCKENVEYGLANAIPIPHLRLPSATMRNGYDRFHPIPTFPTMSNRNHRKTNHWRQMWQRYPERMRNHVDALNRLMAARAEHRENQVRPLIAMLPSGPLQSWEIRDHLAEAWSEVFNEQLTNRQAWLHVRFAMRRGLIRRDENGYFPAV